MRLIILYTFASLNRYHVLHLNAVATMVHAHAHSGFTRYSCHYFRTDFGHPIVDQLTASCGLDVSTRGG